MTALRLKSQAIVFYGYKKCGPRWLAHRQLYGEILPNQTSGYLTFRTVVCPSPPITHSGFYTGIHAGLGHLKLCNNTSHYITYIRSSIFVLIIQKTLSSCLIGIQVGSHMTTSKPASKSCRLFPIR